MIIKVDNLIKEYEKAIKAIDNLCFIVNQGEIVELVGSNGACKTNTLRILVTFIESS